MDNSRHHHNFGLPIGSKVAISAKKAIFPCHMPVRRRGCLSWISRLNSVCTTSGKQFEGGRSLSDETKTMARAALDFGASPLDWAALGADPFLFPIVAERP